MKMRREHVFTWEEIHVNREAYVRKMKGVGVIDICTCWTTALEIEQHKRTRNGPGTPLECTICENLIYPSSVMFTCDDCGEVTLAKKLMLWTDDLVLCPECEEDRNNGN